MQQRPPEVIWTLAGPSAMALPMITAATLIDATQRTNPLGGPGPADQPPDQKA